MMGESRKYFQLFIVRPFSSELMEATGGGVDKSECREKHKNESLLTDRVASSVRSGRRFYSVQL